MKKSTSWIAAFLILTGGFSALRAEAPPLFAPEPPEPAAAALVEAYLPLLAAGQYEPALQLVDLRGMRQYLLDRRLNDLRAKNPELTEQELQSLERQIMQLTALISEWNHELIVREPAPQDRGAAI